MGVLGKLSSDNLNFFNSHGYVVIESFASNEEIEAMRTQMDHLLQGFDSSSSSVFSTKNQQKMTDDYFYETAEKISFFFEVCAETIWNYFSSADPAWQLILQPGIGGEVVPLQDNSFLSTEPKTCTGLWLALEDAAITNGCLWAIPSSHKHGLISRFIRGEEGVYFDWPSPSYDQKDFVPVEVKAGSLVVIHGDLIHQSFENQSSKSRHAYSLHVVDTDGCKWGQENWIRRKVEPEHLYVSSSTQ